MRGRPRFPGVPKPAALAKRREHARSLLENDPTKFYRARYRRKHQRREARIASRIDQVPIAELLAQKASETAAFFESQEWCW
jgi:hypothetical protein